MQLSPVTPSCFSSENKHPRAFFPIDRQRFHCGNEFAVIGAIVSPKINGRYAKSDRLSKSPDGRMVPIWDHVTADASLVLTKTGNWMVCTKKQSDDPFQHEGYLKLEGMGARINPCQLAVKDWQEWNHLKWKPNACKSRHSTKRGVDVTAPHHELTNPLSPRQTPPSQAQ